VKVSEWLKLGHERLEDCKKLGIPYSKVVDNIPIILDQGIGKGPRMKCIPPRRAYGHLS